MPGTRPPPSHTALAALPAVALDLETTGLDVARDRIVQIGAVAMHGPGRPERAPDGHARRSGGFHSRPRHPHPRVDRFRRLRGAASRGAVRFAPRGARRPRRGRPEHPLRSRRAASRGGAHRGSLARPARSRRGPPRGGAGSRARRPRARIARESVRRRHRGAPRRARRRTRRSRDLRRPRSAAARGGRAHPRRGGGIRRPARRPRPPRSGGGMALDAGSCDGCGAPARPRPHRQLPVPAPAR